MLWKNGRGQCQGLGSLHPHTYRAGRPEQVVEFDVKPRSGGIALFSDRRQVDRHSFLFLSLVGSILSESTEIVPGVGFPMLCLPLLSGARHPSMATGLLAPL